DLTAHARALGVALHCGDVEPLVRRNEIGRSRTAGRMHDAKLVKRFAACIGKRCTVGFGEFVTGHFGLPLSPSRLIPMRRYVPARIVLSNASNATIGQEL